MDAHAPIGLLSALPGELGSHLDGDQGDVRSGIRILPRVVGGVPVLAAVSGVGKVAAAHAAGVLLGEGARGLLVVGTCGALARGLAPGDLFHCTTAFQVDLAVREGRQVVPDPAWLKAWQAVSPAAEGWFLTADRPVVTPWRRLRLARAFRGPCVAEMETGAVGAVAAAAGVPWAALRVVTDLAGPGTRLRFRQNYPTMGGRPADTLVKLLPHLS